MVPKMTSMAGIDNGNKGATVLAKKPVIYAIVIIANRLITIA